MAAALSIFGASAIKETGAGFFAVPVGLKTGETGTTGVAVISSCTNAGAGAATGFGAGAFSTGFSVLTALSVFTVLTVFTGNGGGGGVIDLFILGSATGAERGAFGASRDMERSIACICLSASAADIVDGATTGGMNGVAGGRSTGFVATWRVSTVLTFFFKTRRDELSYVVFSSATILNWSLPRLGRYEP